MKANISMARFKRSAAAIAAAFSLLIVTAPAQAESAKVVVSLPALHSLVSSLLKNVATPQLLMPDHLDTHLVDLSAQQIQILRQADLVIWSGPALEGAIAETQLIMPDLAARSLTLSRHVPLITPAIAGTDQPETAKDLRFWLDPRLTHHALHTLAPALVRLFPDASDTILDNEIALMAEVHHVEHSMRAALGTEDGTPVHLGNSDLVYLQWRFNLPVNACDKSTFDPMGFKLAAGPGLYTRMMDDARVALSACMDSKQAGTAMNQRRKSL